MGGDPEALAMRRPAITKIGFLMDVRLVPVDQQVTVALSAGQQVLHLSDEGLPLCRIGPTEQLLGPLPGQIQTMQGRPDRLSTIKNAKALAHPADQAPQRPPRRGIGTGYRRSGSRAPGGAEDGIQFGCDARAKGGRPPVRREASAAAPRSL